MPTTSRSDQPMDISDTVAPNSDQLDAIDLHMSGPRTFTIEKVSKGNPEQPVNIHLAEFPRVWRPGKSMRRVLISAWGPDAAQYVGRRLTLWCDPAVRFGGAEVGGIRITRLSHIDSRKVIPLLVTRGKSAPYVVEPLPDEPAEDPRTKLGRLIREQGLQKDEALAYFGSLVGREIEATKELTDAEVATVIAALESQAGDAA